MLKIRIVHVIGRLGRGGAERFVIDICNEMSRHDRFEIYILSLSENDPEESFVNEINPEVNYISLNKPTGFSLEALLTLTKWLKALAPHVVHSHMNSFEYLTLFRLQDKGALFFHTLHNVAREECPGLLIKTIRQICFWLNRVVPITISENGSKTYRSYYGMSNDVLIKNARPLPVVSDHYQEISSVYKQDLKQFLLVHIGRISAEKNQQLLLQAVQQFNNTEAVKIRLLIIGGVQDQALFEALRGIAGDDKHVEFLGGKSNVADYLCIADAFCLSSAFEGMPISIIEAMALGCIPICTPVGGMVEMIEDGVTGFISQDLSVACFLATLKRALYSACKQDIQKRIVLEFYEKYHIGISAENHLNTYVKMLNSAGNTDISLKLFINQDSHDKLHQF
ncbi:glycosyltransferase [Pedobacter sp. MC2016-24]|uniref:glycosyltransferase n=1 Tax=Pedobacter sp. MC2016-24 TaxID=2780090 RepID=UPI0018825176|nr:glycosyltransferase [Pedobacter sp. MC2016-24]MBE9601658.1 glycosyltransferase [Pedobacter sp. MC2016-24]